MWRIDAHILRRRQRCPSPNFATTQKYSLYIKSISHVHTPSMHLKISLDNTTTNVYWLIPDFDVAVLSSSVKHASGPPISNTPMWLEQLGSTGMGNEHHYWLPEWLAEQIHIVWVKLCSIGIKPLKTITNRAVHQLWFDKNW